MIQIQSDETTSFSNQIVGTTRHIDEYQTWNNTLGDLTNIPATTNIYPYIESDGYEEKKSSQIDSKSKQKMITELRVFGNVTGILIPNTHEIIVRVLVPIIDDEGEINQDVRYVEWRKVRVDFFHILTQFLIQNFRFSIYKNSLKIFLGAWQSLNFTPLELIALHFYRWIRIWHAYEFATNQRVAKKFLTKSNSNLHISKK